MPSVGFNDIGFYVPSFISLCIVVVLASYRRFRGSHRSLVYYLIVLFGILVLSVILFQVATAQRSLSIPPSWSLTPYLTWEKWRRLSSGECSTR